VLRLDSVSGWGIGGTTVLLLTQGLKPIFMKACFPQRPKSAAPRTKVRGFHHFAFAQDDGVLEFGGSGTRDGGKRFRKSA